MSKRPPFKYPKWKLSSHMDSEAFVKMIFLKKKNKVLELPNLGILVLLNKEIIYVTQKFYFHYKF